MSNKSKEFSWAKFRQYGWRCSTNEDSYSNTTLIGNWSEERVDTRRTVALRRPLPHQFSHYFETTYYSISFGFNKINMLTRESRSFPGHQPERDPPQTKCVPNSCYRLDFKGPQRRVDIVGETSEPQCGSVAETN
uniref:Chromosome 11 open reading frame 1 n=1 Tax=Sinocyclocheilus anshuiensis TaxID=1608454 RepID=A0A671Q4L1_9TELE